MWIRRNLEVEERMNVMIVGGWTSVTDQIKDKLDLYDGDFYNEYREPYCLQWG